MSQLTEQGIFFNFGLHFLFVDAHFDRGIPRFVWRRRRFQILHAENSTNHRGENLFAAFVSTLNRLVRHRIVKRRNFDGEVNLSQFSAFGSIE